MRGSERWRGDSHGVTLLAPAIRAIFKIYHPRKFPSGRLPAVLGPAWRLLISTCRGRILDPAIRAPRLPQRDDAPDVFITDFPTKSSGNLCKKKEKEIRGDPKVAQPLELKSRA